jgi:hypothetical protein
MNGDQREINNRHMVPRCPQVQVPRCCGSLNIDNL